MKINAEDRWVRLYGSRSVWGVKVVRGMKTKDIPADIRCAMVRGDQLLDPLRFHDGSFYAVKWVQSNPLYWPDAFETEIRPGDYIIETESFGVDFIRGQERCEIPMDELEASRPDMYLSDVGGCVNAYL